MTSIRSIALAMALSPALFACNSERKQECEKFLAAMKPIDDPSPTADSVDRVQKDVDAIGFQDLPLREYAKNYKQTLTVLASTLRLKASPSAPDGTDDVIKTQLKAARTDKEDIARYCAQ
jgi:hypothetical protein